MSAELSSQPGPQPKSGLEETKLPPAGTFDLPSPSTLEVQSRLQRDLEQAFDRAQFSEALKLSAEIVEQARSAYGNDSLKVADALIQQAELHDYCNDGAGNLERLTQAGKILRLCQETQSDTPAIALKASKVMNMLALALVKQDSADASEAQKWFEQSWKIAPKDAGVFSLAAQALGHTKLAELYHFEGNLKKVEEQSEAAIKAFRRIDSFPEGEERSLLQHYALALDALSFAKFWRGDQRGARESAIESMSVRAPWTFDYHPAFAEALLTYARLDLSDMNLAQAAARAERARKIMTDAFPEGHPERIRALIMSSQVRALNNRALMDDHYVISKAQLNAPLDSLREVLAQTTIDTPVSKRVRAQTLIALAKVSLYLGVDAHGRPADGDILTEGREYAEEAHQLARSFQPMPHFSLGQTCATLAEFEFLDGRTDQGIGFYEDAIDAYSASCGPDAASCHILMNSLANLAWHREDYEQAEIWADRILENFPEDRFANHLKHRLEQVQPPDMEDEGPDSEY